MNKIILIVIIVLALVGLFIVLPTFTGDFHDFYTAAKLYLNGHSPYEWPRFYNPIWTLIIIIPFTIFPEYIAYKLFTIVALLGISYFVYKQEISIKRKALLISILAVTQIVFGNLEWAVLLGTIVNPFLGIWLALLKPQLGIILAMVLFLGLSLRLKLISGGLLALLMLYSFSLGFHTPNLNDVKLWNISPFPLLVPLGILFIYLAIRSRDKYKALISGLCISPYWQIPSLMVSLPWTSRKSKVLFIGMSLLILILFVYGLIPADVRGLKL